MGLHGRHGGREGSGWVRERRVSIRWGGIIGGEAPVTQLLGVSPRRRGLRWRERGEIMQEVAATRGHTNDHRAHGAETGDRVIHHNLGPMGEVVAPNVRDEKATTGDGGRGQGKDTLGCCLGEIDGQAGDVSSERVRAESSNSGEEPLVGEKAGITVARDCEYLAMGGQASGPARGDVRV